MSRNRQDICIIRGETLKETISVEGIAADDLPCTNQMVLRISRRGRIFASIPVDISFTFSGEEASAELYASADEMTAMPALEYVYDIYSQCNSKKKVVASGFLKVLPNTNTDLDLDCEGVLPVADVAIDAPVITSANQFLQICCCPKEQPLYFEINDEDGLSDAYVDTDFGNYIVQARYRGQWVNDPAFSIGATRYRIAFTRFLHYRDGAGPWNNTGKIWGKSTPLWERGMWKGGTDTCNGCERPPCEPFSLTIFAEDKFGQMSNATFDVAIADETQLT